MARWTAVVRLATVDVSARLTDRITIDAEESTARIATFTLRPAAGVVDVREWIGASVTIDYQEPPAAAIRLFTGSVSEPVYDPKTRLTSYQCTDDLQGHFNAMTEAQILTAISGGYYDESVFGVRDSGWTQAEDVLSTVNKGYDILKDGTTAILTGWDAKTTPDFTYSGSTAKDISVDMARLRDIVNKVVVAGEYRFTRLHHREHDFSWEWPGTGFCDYFAQSHELPSRDMVTAAASGTQWTNKYGRICFETLPASMNDACSSGNGWVITPEMQLLVCTSAVWRGVRRWAQTITEQYNLTVTEAGSVAQYGAVISEDGAGTQTDYDSGGWDSSFGTDDPLFLGGSLAAYDPDGCGGGGLELTPEDSWTWGDESDDTERTSLLNTLIAVARIKILDTHRQNYVSWVNAIEPTIERTHTASISAAGVTAKGKVFQYSHELNIGTGEALTTTRIAVSKCPAGGSDDALTAPASPDTESGYTPPTAFTSFSTRLGNDDTVADYDIDWEGFTGNYALAVGTPTAAQTYPRRFRAVGPDIEDTSRDELTGTVTQTINVQAPDETLTVTA